MNESKFGELLNYIEEQHPEINIKKAEAIIEILDYIGREWKLSPKAIANSSKIAREMRKRNMSINNEGYHKEKKFTIIWSEVEDLDYICKFMSKLNVSFEKLIQSLQVFKMFFVIEESNEDIPKITVDDFIIFQNIITQYKKNKRLKNTLKPNEKIIHRKQFADKTEDIEALCNTLERECQISSECNEDIVNNKQSVNKEDTKNILSKILKEWRILVPKKWGDY